MPADEQEKLLERAIAAVEQQNYALKMYFVSIPLSSFYQVG